MEEIGINDPLLQALIQELDFSFTRGGGPGGQHVNKVSTRVELRFHVDESGVLSEEQKELIKQKLKTRITKDGILILSSTEERSQIRNKQRAIDRFLKLIIKALTVEKIRVGTHPPLGSRLTRLDDKKKISEKKQFRKKPDEI